MIANKRGTIFNDPRVEICPVCDEAFHGTITGDLHRVIDFKYRTAISGRHIVHIPLGDDIPDGYTVIGQGVGESYRCLTPDEMQDSGLKNNDEGAWSLMG